MDDFVIFLDEIEKIKNGDYGTEEESFNWYNEADKNKVDKEYKDKYPESYLKKVDQ